MGKIWRNVERLRSWHHQESYQVKSNSTSNPVGLRLWEIGEQEELMALSSSYSNLLHFL